MPLYQYIITLLCGAGFGVIVSWVPFASAACSVLAVLTILFLFRSAFSANFRKSHICPVQFNVLFFAWLVIIIFMFHPTGIHTFLPVMSVNNEELSTLLDEWKEKAPNIEINCVDDVLDAKVSINTITPITIDEALTIVDRQLGTKHDYLIQDRGRSIARGPHIKVTIKYDTDIYGSEDGFQHEAPYHYDGLR